MAESDFTIQIPIEADLAPFRATLRAGLEEAAKGVTIPVRAGGIPGGGGQGARVSTAYSAISASEQLAVDAAFNRMRDTPPRGGYAPVMGQGGAFAPRVDTSGVAAGFSEIFKRWEPLRKEIERPVRITVDASQALATLETVRKAGIGLPVAAGGPGGFTSASFQEDAIEQTISGLPAGGAAATGARRAWGNLRGGSLLPTSSFRGLFGILGLHEIANAFGAAREGSVEAALARTPEEAQLARANALQQASGGLFGTAAFFVPNLLDSSYSPQRIAREAREAVALRNQSDELRQQQFATAADFASRRGFAEGGTSLAGLERARILAQGQTADLNKKISDLDTRLSQVAPELPSVAPGIGPSFDKPLLTGEARANAIRARQQNVDELRNVQEQSAFDRREFLRDRAFFAQDTGRAVNLANLIGRGASDRDVAQQQLLDAQASRRNPLIAKYGEGIAPILNAQDAAERRAQAFRFNQQDQNQLAGLQSVGDIANLQAQNRPLDARIAEIRANAAAQGRAALQAGGPNLNNILAGIAAAEQAQVKAAQAEAGRGFQVQAIGQVGQAQQLQALLNRDPLGAQLAGINAQRDAALATLPNDARGRALAAGINLNANLQTQLATRADAERRGDIAASLESATRQSVFRTRGGDENRVRATLDQIVSETARDATQLERQGDRENARRRRDLGQQQVREARADYYRSFSFDEVGGDRIAASRRGSFGGLTSDFENAERQAGSASSTASTNATAAQTFNTAVQQFVTAIQQLVSRGIPPRLP